MVRGRMNNAGIVLFVFVQISALCNSFSLSTNSRWIVDERSGRRVKLACVNWPSHVEPMIAEGLEKKPLNYIARLIGVSGFNCVRFTWATYMFTRPDYGSRTVWESLDRYNLTAAKAGIARNNPKLLHMKLVDVHRAVVNKLGKHKIMVILDNHVSRPGWCCSATDGNGFFGDANFNPEEWLQGLAAVAKTYKDNPAVVGMSMRNELRGERQNEADWYRYMRQGGNTIHKQNPKVLVIVSGLNVDTNLGFLKSKPLALNLHNKLVYEAHWYSFDFSSDQWAAQTNQLCARVTQRGRDNYFFLLTAPNNNSSFPLFLSEFGADQRGVSEADNRYITCLLAAAAEFDVDWALWTLQGSYIFREGKPNSEETYGVVDFNWDRPANPAFLRRLQLLRQINQDYKSKHPMHYKMFHPLSGQCVQMGLRGLILGNCIYATRWDQDHHHGGGAIKIAGTPWCLGLSGDGAPAHLSRDCSSKWRPVSSSALHLAAQDGRGNHLCLEKNASDNVLVTNKCLCVRDDLKDQPTCSHNPQAQWFKLVPANV